MRSIKNILKSQIVITTLLAFASSAIAQQESESAERAPSSLTIFGEEFRIRAYDVRASSNEETSEIEYLIAKYDVTFETEDISITSHELFYSDSTKFLRAVGSESQKCVVKQSGAITLCDVFIYDAEAGTGEFFGNPDVTYEGGTQNILIGGSELDFSQQEESGTQLIVGREPLRRRDFESPDVFEFEAPEGSRFSTMSAVPAPPPFIHKEGTVPFWVLDQNLPRVVSPVGPKRPGFVDDDSEVELIDIEPEEPLWEKGIDEQTGTSTE